jgi:hypothetical protein
MSFDVGLRTWHGGLTEVLQLNSGVTFYPRGPRFGQQLYVDQCFLAREDWRPCDDGTAAALADNCVAQPASSIVELLRLDSSLVERLRAACPPDRKLDPPSMCKAPFADLLAVLAPHWHVESELYPLGYAVYPPGFKTVTFDARHSRFIGLHIDEIDGLPMNQRSDARLRICINLGPQERHLVFIPVTVNEMARRLSYSTAELAHQPSTPFIAAFMQAFPDQFALRLGVAPGEAYVAPTENLIHDASTMRMSVSDLSLTILVHLRRRADSGAQR